MTKNAAGLFACTFFAVITLMVADAALIGLMSRTWREITFIEDLQTDDRKTVNSLKTEISWAHDAVQEMRDEQAKMFHVKQGEKAP